MATINTAVILLLADSAIQTDAQKYGTEIVGSDDAFNKTLQEEANKRRVEAEKAAATVILDVVELKNTLILADVQRVAALKEEIAKVEKHSQELATATTYGFESRNFLPLALLTGAPVPAGAKKDQFAVPKDWVAKKPN